MDNKQVTAEWIAKQRKLWDEDSLARFVLDAKAAIPELADALEASMQREDEKDAIIDRLSAERYAEKRRADAGAIRTAVRPFEKGDEHTLTKFSEFCKRLAASHRPDMPSGDRMLLLLTDLCIDRLCVSMQRVTEERDAAVCDMFGCMSTQGQCVRCKKRYYCDGTDDDKFSPLCKNKSHCYAWEWRGLHADNTDAPTGAGSEADHAD